MESSHWLEWDKHAISAQNINNTQSTKSFLKSCKPLQCSLYYKSTQNSINRPVWALVVVSVTQVQVTVRTQNAEGTVLKATPPSTDITVAAHHWQHIWVLLKSRHKNNQPIKVQQNTGNDENTKLCKEFDGTVWCFNGMLTLFKIIDWLMLSIILKSDCFTTVCKCNLKMCCFFSMILHTSPNA